MSRLVAATLVALALGGCVVVPAGPDYAYANAPYATLPPPTAQVEVVPASPGGAYVWTPGFWFWGGGAYSWRGGRWVVPPAGYHTWRPGYWSAGPRGHHWTPGQWR